MGQRSFPSTLISGFSGYFGRCIVGALRHWWCYHDCVDGNDDDENDIYIMVKCLSVCLSVTKRHHFYSKDFVVSPVYSYIPYSKELVVSMFLDTFRTQRNWPFPCFLTLLYSKDLVVSHVYRHFP